MIQYIWPLLLVVTANTLYQLSAKAVPEQINPFASLTITYVVGAIFSAILFFVTNRNANLLQEYQKANWAPYVLGLAIVGLEVGFLYGYKAGWAVSKFAVVSSSLLGIVLLFAGYLIYHEVISLSKVLGIAVCLVGLGILNMK